MSKDSVAASAGELLRLREWQRGLLRGLLAVGADGRFRHREALIGMPRKNGKSQLGAGIALDSLVFGPHGGEVYACAGDKEQARIVFGTARRMVEMDPELSGILKPYRDAIEHPATGSVFRVLSAEAYTKEGLNPHLVLFDEVHVQPNRELWDVMSLATGARREPLLVGITTAGVKTDSTGQDSLCYSLFQHGQKVASGEVDDPTFFFAWWAAEQDADYRDPTVWRGCNPGYDVLVAEADFEAKVSKTPENEFRIKRLNQWVSGSQAWLPAGSWTDCDTGVGIDDGTDVVLAFDGSFSNDSTALVAVTCGGIPHIDVAGCWERPTGLGDEWRVPIAEVEQAIRDACRRWQVREIVCDPFRWARSMQVLEDEGLPVVEFPQSPARMVPATQRFFEAVLNAGVTHSGDPRLARHIDNCVLKTDQRGSRLAKETKTSSRKIDLAVAAVMGLDRASQRAEAASTFFVY